MKALMQYDKLYKISSSENAIFSALKYAFKLFAKYSREYKTVRSYMIFL